jgi:hypothetical protein
MAQENFARLLPRGGFAAQDGDFEARFAVGGGVVNNRLRVIETNPASGGNLLVDWHAVWFGKP